MEFGKRHDTRNGLLPAPTCYRLSLVTDLSFILWTCYGEVANLLRTCYGETGVMDFGLYRAQRTSLTSSDCSCCISDLIQLSWTSHLTATECHLPYGITQCYLPPDTSQPQPDRLVRDFPTPEGWKAELTYVTGNIPRWFTAHRRSLVQVLIFGCWLLPQKISVCPKNNGFAWLRGLNPQSHGLYAL